jgi:CheY-like chemotaxis protein
MKQNAKPRKILVVDDDPIIRDMMVDMLDLEGYAVRTARNGREALELLHSEENYLVFLDLMMPGIDGKKVCEALEGEPHVRSRHIIVIMSAMEKQEEALSLNVDAMMPKPFVVEDVMGVMEPYIET